MTRPLVGWLLVPCLFLATASPGLSQGKFGEQAPDFPSGSCTDGLQHSLGDGQGKLTVLFFFEPK
jgi:hypothetical protein